MLQNRILFYMDADQSNFFSNLIPYGFYLIQDMKGQNKGRKKISAQIMQIRKIEQNNFINDNALVPTVF